MDPFIKAVADYIEANRLLEPGDGVVVGFSGGPDSTALLVALVELRSRWDLALVAAHLDHGLRDEASQADARFAEDLARQLGVRFVLRRADVNRLARSQGTSVEAAGRIARYHFFRDVAQGAGCARIAVGHHRDDQIENVLWRLLTGSGSDGLAGMRPRQGAVIRPMLAIPQKEILQFLERRHIPYRIDHTNVDPQYYRNRIRHELLPLLRQHYNRQIDDAIWRTSQILAEEAAYLETAAAKIVDEAAADLPGDGWYKRDVLQAAPPALRRRALRQIVWSFVGADDTFRITRAHVADLDMLVQGRKQAVVLPKGIQAELQQQFIHFSRVKGAAPGPDEAGSLQLPVPGSVTAWPPWSNIHAELVPAHQVSPEDFSRPGHAYMDFEAAGSPDYLTVRRWQKGDRMLPLGAPGSRKLHDIFIDRRIPRGLRHRIPIITCGDRILWVVGVALADHVKVGEETRRIVHIWVDENRDFTVLR